MTLPNTSHLYMWFNVGTAFRHHNYFRLLQKNMYNANMLLEVRAEITIQSQKNQGVGDIVM